MLGLDHRIGSLAVGKQADIVLLRKDDLNMFPVHDPLLSLVTQAGISNVDTVLIGGRLVKRGGQLLFANIAEKKAALQRSGERILRDFGELPRAAQHMIPKSGNRFSERSWASKSSVVAPKPPRLSARN